MLTPEKSAEEFQPLSLDSVVLRMEWSLPRCSPRNLISYESVRVKCQDGCEGADKGAVLLRARPSPFSIVQNVNSEVQSAACFLILQ